jgi:protein gp37
MAHRLRAAGVPRYAQGFDVREHQDLLGQPERWRAPRRIFVCSMSDLFHPRVSGLFIARVFAAMAASPRHTFQVLTKRPARMASDAEDYLQPWPPNVWAGATIEGDAWSGRADDLRKIPAKVRFLSLEPLLGPLPSLDLSGIHWVIVGGETGPRARSMSAAWVADVRDRCAAARIPFFFKRWGGRDLDRGSHYLDGCLWQEFPS